MELLSIGAAEQFECLLACDCQVSKSFFMSHQARISLQLCFLSLSLVPRKLGPYLPSSKLCICFLSQQLGKVIQGAITYYIVS